MEPETSNPDVPLIGSPYDLRVSLGEKVGETGIRAALDSGDWGFVHSFQTGSAVDGPGVRLVAWLSGCQFRCVFCHNPDTWKVTNGMPVTLARAVEVVSQYRHSLRTMKGGLTVSGGEPLQTGYAESTLHPQVVNAAVTGATCAEYRLRLGLAETRDETQPEPHGARRRSIQRLQRAVPIAVIDVRMIHLNAVFPRIAHELGRLVEAHGLAVQDCSAEHVGVEAFDPGGDVDE